MPKNGRSAYLGGINEMTPTEILEIAPFDSPLWGFGPYRLFKLIGVHADPRDDPEAAAEILRLVFESNPDRLVQGHALASLVFCAERSRQGELARRLFRQLESEYGDLAELDPLRRMNDPDRRARTGLPIPDFSFVLADGSMIRADDLNGRWTLVHLWATWCGPCIGEMPQLHLANETFSGHRLRVLSISIDKNPDTVARFRAERFAMPWLHAVPAEGDFHQGVKALNPIGGVPQLLLVSPTGIVVSTSEDLRGERLIPTLTRHLGPPDRE